MVEDRQVLKAAAELGEAGEPFILVTVIAAKGSTPRDPGAKMLWRPPGRNGTAAVGGWVGTVGGGQFERLVIDDAQKHLRSRSCGLEHYVLGADADQCCGGTMDVFFEYHGPRQRVVIFGAGHVSQALVQVLAGAPFEITVVDDRPDWNSAGRFPHARRIAEWDEGVAAAQQRPDATLALVMTCSHDTDLELLRSLLRSPPAFTGLIGSRSKRVCLFGRLVASGVSEEVVQRVHCPIGVGDTGKEPKMVAISMAAQLLLEAKSLAGL